ncbi:MAG: hypothetical protein ABI811_00010 [Acidobacteriota bacterium]
MVSVTIRHSPEQRRTIAEFASGKRFSEPLNIAPAPALCPTRTGGTFKIASGAQWNGWGQNAPNNRFQSNPGLITQKRENEKQKDRENRKTGTDGPFPVLPDFSECQAADQ